MAHYMTDLRKGHNVVSEAFMVFWFFLPCRIFEDGGTVYNFFGNEKGCSLKTSIRVHDPAFYWKVKSHATIQTD